MLASPGPDFGRSRRMDCQSSVHLVDWKTLCTRRDTGRLESRSLRPRRTSLHDVCLTRKMSLLRFGRAAFIFRRKMGNTVLFRNLKLLDPRFDESRDGYEILVENSTFKEVSERPISSRSAQIIDCGGRILMPGLIDCHAHVFLSELSVSNLEQVPISLLTARA